MRGLARLRNPGFWRGLAAGVGLTLLTVLVAAAYVLEPQSPRDFTDRLTLAVDGDAYGPNLRSGSRLYARATRARAAGADSLADAYLWRVVTAYTRASQAAPGPGTMRRTTGSRRLISIWAGGTSSVAAVASSGWVDRLRPWRWRSGWLPV